MSNPPESLSRTHLPALDGIRGCATLAVMLLHFSTALRPEPDSAAAAIKSVFQWGWTGVDLFFVLSGFLITGILYDAKGKERFFRTFYFRRALRIFPLYYGTLAVYFLCAWRLGGPAYHVALHDQAFYWAYLGNFRRLPLIGHFWSLGIEEQFYLVWPLVVFVSTRTQLLKVCALAVVGALVFRSGLLLLGASGSTVYHYTFGRIDGLALGATVALVLRSPCGREHLRRWSRWVGGAAAILLATLIVRENWLDEKAKYFELMSMGYTLIALLFAAGLAAIVIAVPSSMPVRALSSAPLVTFGKFSYALYVFHPFVLRAVEQTPLGYLASTAQERAPFWILCFPTLMILVSLAVASLSWHLFEKHFLKLKRHFHYSSRPVGDG